MHKSLEELLRCDMFRMGACGPTSREEIRILDTLGIFEQSQWTKLFRSSVVFSFSELMRTDYNIAKCLSNSLICVKKIWESAHDGLLYRPDLNPTFEYCMYKVDERPYKFVTCKKIMEIEKGVILSNCTEMFPRTSITKEYSNRSMMVINWVCNLIRLNNAFNDLMTVKSFFAIKNLVYYILAMFYSALLSMTYTCEIISICYQILTDVIGDCPSLHRFRIQIDNMLLGHVSAFRCMIAMNCLTVDLLKGFPGVAERVELLSDIGTFGEHNYMEAINILVGKDYSFGCLTSMELYNGTVRTNCEAGSLSPEPFEAVNLLEARVKEKRCRAKLQMNKMQNKAIIEMKDLRTKSGKKKRYRKWRWGRGSTDKRNKDVQPNCKPSSQK